MNQEATPAGGVLAVLIWQIKRMVLFPADDQHV